MEIFPWHYRQYNRISLEKAFVFDLQMLAGEKTEDPTSKRRSDARKKGQVGRSQELSAVFVLLAGFFVMRILGSSIYNELISYTIYVFGHLNQGIDIESVMRLIIGIMTVLAKTALPIMCSIMVIGMAVNLFQVGINFTTEPLAFKLSNLNPITGMGRIFSKRSLVELAKSLLKILIIGAFIYQDLKEEIFQLPKYIYYDLGTGLSKMADVIFLLAFKICAVYLVLAILDYAYQKWQTTQDLKMSKDDVKEEFKQTEGDPQIKGKIRSKQREMAMQRMMQEVPKADVIVTNPTHYAVALQYKTGMMAPTVVAKGQDLVAKRIKDVARENRVAIVENRPLARALYAMVDIGGLVPQELYKAVAEVLAYVYRLKKKR
jgi:flagellar biosynthetic protein FlhB